MEIYQDERRLPCEYKGGSIPSFLSSETVSKQMVGLLHVIVTFILQLDSLYGASDKAAGIKGDLVCTP